MVSMRIGIALALAAGLAGAQTFEVASVKVSGPQSKRDAGGGPGTSDPGQFHANASPLLLLILMAYHVDSFQVSSKTPLDRDLFDLTAKVPPGATRDQFRLMLQNLLAERFHLKLHKESREFPAYELTVAKSGPKFQKSAQEAVAQTEFVRPKVSADGFVQLAPNRSDLATVQSVSGGYIVVRMTARHQPMSTLARVLRSQQDQRPIVDATGLAGEYDFQLEYTREIPGAAPTTNPQAPVAPDMFTALTQQLGLKLVPKKLPFEVLVIEAFDKTPVEN